MEQCFRIALWMCLLMGYLQAGPLNRTVRSTTSCSIVEEDFSLNRLKGQDISSGVANMTFRFPDWPGQCYVAEAEVYIEELGKIQNHTETRLNLLVSDALKALQCAKNSMKEKQTKTDCNLDKTVHGNMTTFVDALEKFVKKIITEN